ncbi:hypothetical protein [Pseudoxanthomonas wuyuanensis]
MDIISNPSIPHGGAMVARFLEELHGRGLAHEELQQHPLSSIEAGLPHYIRETTLQDMAAGATPLDQAPISGMRYLLRGPLDVAGAVDLALTAGGTDATRVAGLIGGEQIHRLNQALRRLDEHSANYRAELSLLRCRGLDLEALLLSSPGQETLVFPLLTGGPSLKGHVYKEAEYRKALQHEAQRALKQFGADGDGENASEG